MFALKKCFAGLFTLACITSAHAIPVTLDFTLPDLVPGVPEAINGYYGGGTDAGGAAGPNYGISFPGSGTINTTGVTSNEGGFALVDTTNPPPPQGGNALVFPLPPGAVDLSFLFDSAGTNYLSFDYLGALGGEGISTSDASLLSTVLTPLGSGWTHEDLTFSGAVSVFSFLSIGPDGGREFANMTLNGASPGVSSVPEHTGWGTYGLAGLALLGMCRLFRTRPNASS
jgi:hypothetical protein